MKAEAAQYRLSQRTLQVYQDGQVANFDRSGRFKMLSGPHRTVRRGLDGRIVEVVDTGGSTHNRQYRVLNSASRAAFLKDIYDNFAIPQSDPSNDKVRAWLTQVQKWDLDALARDEAAFREVYLPVSILPPGEYQSVVVQLTEGCSYNQCLFCDFYRDRPFHIKNQGELEQHLRKIQTFFGERLQDRSGVFLGDGNALVVPAPRLLRALGSIREELGSVSARFSTFMDTFNLKRKSKTELTSLREAGLDTVYVGLESGQDELRGFLRKPGTAEEALQAISHLKAAGLRVSPIVLAGIGDKFSRDHYLETADLLKKAPLDEGDLVFVSPFIEPENHQYTDALKARGWVPFSKEESAAEAMNWIRLLRRELSAKVTLYSILEHLY